MESSRIIKASVIPEFKDLYTDEYRYLVYYSGRSTGKSFAIIESQVIRAISGYYRFLDGREIQNSIKESVKSLIEVTIKRLGVEDLFTITKDNITCRTTGSYWSFIGLRDNPTKIQSYAEFDECFIEEAQSLSMPSLRALLPTIRKPGSRVIFAMNRLTDSDPVFEYFTETPPPRTLVKYLEPETLDNYGLQSHEVIDLREADKASPWYAHVWLGEPLAQIDNAIINRDKLIKAFERKVNDDGAWEVGVDVARFGSDRSVFVARKGLKATSLAVYQHKPLTEQATLLRQFIAELTDDAKSVRIKIDDTGVGSGLTDILVQQGLNVVPVNFAQQAKQSDKYPNAASEMWFDFAEQVDQVSLYGVADHRQELLSELAQRSWTFDSKGRRVVEQKSAFKAQGHRSPDIADALLLCFYEPKEKHVMHWW